MKKIYMKPESFVTVVAPQLMNGASLGDGNKSVNFPNAEAGGSGEKAESRSSFWDDDED